MSNLELVGNALCLDFANTVNTQPAPRHDWLATASQATTWARAANHAIEDHIEVEATLPAARDLRETLYRVFQPLTCGQKAPQPDLDALTTLHAEGVSHGRIEEHAGRFRLCWSPARTMRILLWEVAESAVALLTMAPLERLGECPSCRWLYLDTSKNRRRRWCSMTTCGSRDKSRRYYATRSS